MHDPKVKAFLMLVKSYDKYTISLVYFNNNKHFIDSHLFHLRGSILLLEHHFNRKKKLKREGIKRKKKENGKKNT